MNFTDKNGSPIKAGMSIRHNDGDIEKVYAVTTTFGDESLGIMATNPAYLKHHPDCEIEYYDLSNLCLSEWEVINKEKDKPL